MILRIQAVFMQICTEFRIAHLLQMRPKMIYSKLATFHCSMIHDCLVGHVEHQVSKYPKPIYFYLTL